MSYRGMTPTPPRVSELWRALKERLDSAGMQQELGGAGRVFVITDPEAAKPQGTEKQAWGRCVIAPVRRIYGEPEAQYGRFRLVAWLVRIDSHSPGGGHEPIRPLERGQQEAFELLHGWQPEGFVHASLNRPIWRFTDPQTLPLWDEQGGVWYTSAQYRAWLAPAE